MDERGWPPNPVIPALDPVGVGHPWRVRIDVWNLHRPPGAADLADLALARAANR